MHLSKLKLRKSPSMQLKNNQLAASKYLPKILGFDG